MPTTSPRHQTPGAKSASSAPFFRRHATGVTVALFLGSALLLSVAPLPPMVQPLTLASADDVDAALARVFKKPRMTLASLEETPEPDELTASPDDDDARPLPPEPTPRPASATSHPSSDAPAAVLTAMLDPGRALPSPAPEPRSRTAKPPSPAALANQSIAQSVGAPGAAIENPCLAFDAQGCQKTALDPFFVALDDIEQKTRGSHATVVTLGNSLIASDHVTDVVRAQLAERFGSGGRGFLLPDRLSKIAGRRVRTGKGSEGWEIHTFAQKNPKRNAFGFSGSAHESSRRGDRIRWRTDGAQFARLFYLDHAESSPFALSANGQTLMRVAPDPQRATAEDRVLDLELPPGAKWLELVADGPGVVLYGVALARAAPGVVWDTIGVPASEARMYVEADAGIFARQLAAREPSLVVVMVGGNEIRSLAYEWSSRDEVQANYGALIDRVKAAVPDAACLAVSPIDAAKATSAGAELSTRPETLEVVALEREVALAKGCAFFDLFTAMGGEGALGRFHAQGMVHEDLVHPKGKGGDVLGQLFADALLASYVNTPLPRTEVKAKRRLMRPELFALSFPRPKNAPIPQPGSEEARPLKALFDRFRVLENGGRLRVALGQFGASHTAGHRMTDRIRERLSERFGGAGRGFVAVGDHDPALLPGRVLRHMQGSYEVTDGRRVMHGGAVAMTGTKARLLPGARFDIRFCDGCQEPIRRPPGVLELSWLYTPDMGVADIYVNDVQVGVIEKAGRRRDSDVQFLRIPVRGEAHTLSVVVREPGADDDKKKKKHGPSSDSASTPGPVNLLGVAAEVRRPGIVVDAVGLPGSTGMTPQRWRQDLLAEQVSARRYDVLLLAWGTNESALPDLDEVTYRYHFSRTLETLRAASPQASCILMGPADRLIWKRGKWQSAPSYDLVVKVQREIAAAEGCAFYETRAAMGGAGSFDKWRQAGLATDSGVHLTQMGYEKLADLFLQDLLALYAYDSALEEESLGKAQTGAITKRRPPQRPGKSQRKRLSVKPQKGRGG